MRKKCHFCEEPAVDYIQNSEGGRKWLCASHYDRWFRLAKLLGWSLFDKER
jgi:hypothetical protein